VDPCDDVGLDGAGSGEVQDVDLLGLLTEAVDSPDALLDLHRIPGQVVVDNHRAELEVEALARHPGRQHHVAPAGTEVSDPPPPILWRHAAVQDVHSQMFSQPSMKVGDDRAGESEHKHMAALHDDLCQPPGEGRELRVDVAE